MAKNKYQEPTVQESQEIKLVLYQEFEEKFSEKSKILSPEEFEHLRHEYINKNFHQKYLMLKNKK